MTTETPAPIPTTRPDSQLLTIDELSDLLQISVSTIYSHRSLGLPLPPAAKILGRLRWRLSDVEAFIEEQLAKAA